MTAYTDAAKIANYLDVVLTGAQQNQAGIAAQVASDWIDDFKAQSWQATTPVTGEEHAILGDRVFLIARPVLAITSVSTRAPIYVGGSWTPLAVGQYELLNAANGELLIQGWGPGRARVTYTHATLPPAPVAFAATMIAASLLGPTIRPNTSGLESVAVGQNDVSVRFSVDYGSVPSEALSLLGAKGVVIA